MLANQIQQYMKRITHYNPSWIYFMEARLIQYSKLNQCKPPHKECKEKNPYDPIK
jgi:hypothetical protein